MGIQVTHKKRRPGATSAEENEVGMERLPVEESLPHVLDQIPIPRPAGVKGVRYLTEGPAFDGVGQQRDEAPR